MRLTSAEFKKQFGGGIAAQDAGKKAQIRLPKNTGANKTEAEWMRICETRHPFHVAILYEPWTLRLPSGSKYTPDVVAVDAVPGGGSSITCYEVKGPHIHQSGGRSILAFKEARAAYPWMTFIFAQKRDGWATSG